MLSRYSPTLFHYLKLHLDNFLFLSKGQAQGETPMDWRQKRDVSARVTEWLNMADRDGDGITSVEEVGIYLLPSSLSEAEMSCPKRVIASMDDDGNGQIDVGELEAYLRSIERLEN